MNKGKVDRPFARTGVAGREPLRKRGQVLLLSALMMPVLCGMMGLAVDVGVLYNLRRQMQTAADAGAAAAAYELKRGSTNSEIIQAAKGDVALNGFNGSRGETITVNRPPTLGSYAGDNSFVEVLINENAPTYFMRILGIRSAGVGARAVGGLVGSSLGCIYVLDPTADSALLFSGGSTLNASCGVVVNSSGSKAMVASGGAIIEANSVDITGNYSLSGGSTSTPLPNTGVAPSPDPLADLQPPSYGGCTTTEQVICSDKVVTTLNPGVYCGGIKIPSGAHAIFNPGIYVLYGGGLEVTGGSSFEGQHVSFYNTGGGTYRYRPIVLSGGSTAVLSAPESGPMSGVLFFQDRNIVTTDKNVVSGGGATSLEGALYFPTTKLEYSGGSTLGNISQTITIISRLLTFSGGGTLIDSDYANSSSGLPPIKRPALVE